MKRWSMSVASVVLLITVAGCGLFYPVFAGGPYKGRVIDSETKQPLEGAVVLAVWDSVTPTIADTVDSYLDAEEVLTDSNGRFVVGKHPPTSWRLGWVEGPKIIVFYPGYGFYPLYHISPPMPLRGTEELLERMEKEELVIELPPLKTREERLKVEGGVLYLSVPDEKMPNLIRLLNLERGRLGLDPVHTK